MPVGNDFYPVLIGQNGPLNGERWVIRGPMVIGRGEDCDIVIPDRKISRHHARVQPGGGGIILEDLNSKNGTHYNGHPLKGSVALSDGDLIQIALAQKFTYLSSDATIPLEFDAPIEAGLEKRRLRMDKRSRRVWANSKEIIPPLSVAQFTMLELLYMRDGLVVPREELVKVIWGEEGAYGVSDQALDALVRRLRDRLAEVDKSHEYVVTVRGHGIRLDNPPLEA
ncbi:MAG: FHA domain-containing protein [Chloroflexi bacterium]|nr:FHA domain-containing protein [Chloroflexota bacterium]